MNFLNGSLVRYGRAIIWNSPCYRDVLKTSQLVDIDDQKICATNRPIAQFRLELLTCAKHLRAASLPIMWTQVRYKDYPRLHRDIEFPNFDAYRKDEYKDIRKTDWGEGDTKSGFTYAVGFFGFLCGTYGVKTMAIHYMSFMTAAADVLAMASIDVDISKIAPGGCVSYKWRGKPLFIKNRTQAERDLEEKTPLASLRDPQTPEARTIKPEWLVVIGICTHLGCVPIPNTGDYAGGFYCPCHGSHYDNVGRARKGPAPTNLEVPPYKFISDTVVVVG